MGRKVSWGKQRNLQRCHFLLSDILEKLLKGKTEEGTLQVVLGLRAVHQAAIDGEWTVAWMLTHLPDVWSKKQWGGDPEDLGERCQLSSFDAGVEQKHGTASQFSQQLHSGSSRPLFPPKNKNKKERERGRKRKRQRVNRFRKPRSRVIIHCWKHF